MPSHSEPVQLIVSTDDTGATILEDEVPASELARHEAQRLFEPAPEPMRGQTALELD